MKLKLIESLVQDFKKSKQVPKPFYNIEKEGWFDGIATGMNAMTVLLETDYESNFDGFRLEWDVWGWDECELGTHKAIGFLYLTHSVVVLDWGVSIKRNHSFQSGFFLHPRSFSTGINLPINDFYLCFGG